MGFSDSWKRARQNQAHFLANKCVQLTKTVTPKTAHVVRVQFDILRWFCGRIHPDVYGDKPTPTPNNTTVNVGVSISPERLSEIRGKLDQTRTALQERAAAKATATNGSKPEGKTLCQVFTDERNQSTEDGLTNGAPSLRDRK